MMRSFSFQYKAVLLICFVFAAHAAYGQDLGSSNKLFGGKSPSTSKPSTAKKASKKTTTTKVKAPIAKAKVSIAKTPHRKPATVVKKPTNSTKAVIAPRNTKKIEPDEQTPVVTAGNVTASSPAIEAQYEKLIDIGNDARDERDYLTAGNAYNQAKALKPKDARSFLGLGNLYTDQQRWEDAEAAYRSASGFDANDAASLVALSFVLTRPVAAPNLSERYEEAESLARKALKLEPQNSLANDQLGVALELRGEIGAEAETAYRRSIQFDSGFAPAYAHLGRLLRKKGKTEESATAYGNAMTRSNDVATKILVADVMLSEGRINESVQLLVLALKSDPRNLTALTLLGRAMTTQGKYADAEKTLKKSLDVSPASFISYSLLGSLYARQSKFEAADNALIKSMRFVTPFEKRRLATQFEAVGDGYVKTGNTRNAGRAYRQAISLDPERETLSSKLAKFK